MARAWVATDFGGPEVLEEIDAEVAQPGPGEVTIEVRAAGMNPTDYKQIGREGDRSKLPMRLGHEVSGVLSAIGPDTGIATGGGAVGDPVLAFRVPGGYATELTVPARDVFAKPANLGFPEAANLLLVGTTAADMLRLVEPPSGSTVLVHGASGSVGVSLLQLARLRGLRVIGTAGERNFDRVREFDAIPVAYGDGLEQRVRDAAPEGIAASFDTVGTEEAIDVSLAVTPDRDRIVTIAAFERGKQEGIHVTGGGRPDSKAFRDEVRGELVRLAAEGKLVVPMSRTFPFGEAPAALEVLRSTHPGGKLALVR
ncbi:NADP-dependent oxidoreductase [Naasia sp. SYSU D00948]|uniref:NADP-dependent oxidoreductase n=1 Tax=Naasia sp. SYSU D00948 TaxID=2817379 RepID=UPI001B30FD3E|nr:NADP-dependent oxidoreductase [Naasia sp. SYSU D00948]